MYTFNTAAIFFLGHPYIESTTVLSDTKNQNCSLSWRLNYSGAYKYGCSVQIQREFLFNKHHEILIPVGPGATYSGKKKKPL